MARKFCRAVFFTAATSSRYASYILKFMYEFWGYAVNSPGTVNSPGGFPSGFSTFHTNFTEGTSVLATGTDGQTLNGSVEFRSASASFTSALVGKYITLWKQNSQSTDDSIYQIIGIRNSTTLLLKITNGGHPDPISLASTFYTRSNILYRIFDPDISVSSSGAGVNGTYLVFQMTPSSGSLEQPNSGQANSQVQILIRGSGQSIGMVASPGGTWTGVAFTDAINEVSPSGLMSTTGTSVGVQCVISMISDLDGLLAYVRDPGCAASGIISFEAPQRVMSPAQDPNPVCVGCDGTNGLSTTVVGQGILNQWLPNSVGTGQRHHLLVRCLNGDGAGTGQIPTGVVSQITDPTISHTAFRQKAVMSDVIYHNDNAGQFVMARAISKFWKVCPPITPSFHRLGNNGEFLHIQNGVCIPWDNTLSVVGLAPLGF